MRSLLRTALRADGLLLPVLMVIGTCSLYGQSLWPGDINNNGVVNGVDMLYHAVAQGADGPQRQEIGTNWESYNTAPNWQGQFIDGTNYSKADVNGRGRVEASDRTALWRDNYGLTHGAVIPDVFLVGDASTDPQLTISSNETALNAGQEVQLDLTLGSATKPVQNFYGLTFKLRFNPDHIEDEVTEPLWDPKMVRLELASGNWINPTGNDLEAFVNLDNAAGVLEVVILRKGPGTVSGHGEIASVMATGIDDIIFLEGETNTTFTIDEIKLINDNLVEYPVAGSTTTLATQGISLTGLTAQESNQREEAEESSEETRKKGVEANEYAPSHQPIKNNSFNEQHTSTGTITVYPNPVVDRLQARVDSAEEEIVELRLFSVSGQLVRTLPNVQAAQAEMDVSNLPGGNYVLQLETTSGTTVKMISK